jgi:dTDP-D-glucose 4,6-dehydratase
MDRSIDGPAEFMETNVMGTLSSVESGAAHWNTKGRP